MKLFRVLVVACLAATAPLLAQSVSTERTGAAPQRAEGDVVDTAFDPPIGRPLRYRLNREVAKNGATVSVWSTHEIAFSRRSSGYRMQVRVLDAGMNGAEAATQQNYRRLALEFEHPYVLLLDEAGMIEGMEDADRYWAEIIRRTRDRIAQASQPGTPTDSVATEFAMGMLQDTRPEGRLAVLTQYVAPIIEYGGVSLTIGEELSDRVEVAGLMGLSMNQHVRVRADRVENGLLFVSVRTTIPREELVRAVEQLIARIPVTGQGRNNEAERARGLAELRAAQFSRNYEAEYEVALDTGLTRRHRSIDRTNITTDGETHSRTTTVTLERQD